METLNEAARRIYDEKGGKSKAGMVRVTDVTEYELDAAGNIVRVVTRAKTPHERERQLGRVISSYGYFFRTGDWYGSKMDLSGDAIEFTARVKISKEPYA
jgi:hypothetical protein